MHDHDCAICLKIRVGNTIQNLEGKVSSYIDWSMRVLFFCFSKSSTNNILLVYGLDRIKEWTSYPHISKKD
jgi:hypothetical protein